MSGGRFDYMNDRLQDEIFGWTDKPTNAFEDREISELVFDVFTLIHDFDWYKSGDTCEETWLKKKRAFKAKWFKGKSERTKRIIDKAVEELREEMYKTFDAEAESDG